jgi:hypothetical protein
MVAMIIASILFSGCATTHFGGGPQLPANAKIVGGGLSISWTATAKGTAILVEVNSGKIVRTQSLNEGDTFEFDPVALDSIALLNSMFGGPGPHDNETLASLPKDTHFVLYFVPETTAER